MELSDVDRRALPAGFLMEMLEAREQMESDLSSGDNVMRERWEAWSQARRQMHQTNVGAMFGEITSEAQATLGRLRAIALELNAWRYVERMIEQIGEPPTL